MTRKIIVQFVLLLLFLVFPLISVNAQTPTPYDCSKPIPDATNCPTKYDIVVKCMPTKLFDWCSTQNCDILSGKENYYTTSFGSFTNDCQATLESKRQAFYDAFDAARAAGLITPTVPALTAVPTIGASTPGTSGDQTDTIGTTLPTPTPLGEKIQNAIELATQSCGGVDEYGKSLKCCIPSDGVNIDLPLADETGGFIKTMFSFVGGLVPFATNDVTNTNYRASDGSLCGANFDTVGIVNGERVNLDYKYNLTPGKEFTSQSYLNAQGTPVPTPLITYYPKEQVKDCRCELPEGQLASAEQFGGGPGDEYGGKYGLGVIVCSKDIGAYYPKCLDCMGKGKYWLAAIHTCADADIHNIAWLCRNGEGDIRDTSSEIYKCYQCVSVGKMYSGIGCIDYSLESFIQNQVFGWGIGLAGITAILCIIYSSFIMQTSANNPEKIKQSQDMLTSCITGLIIIIMSIFILNIIGVDILRIPEFGKTLPTPTPVP